MTRLLVAVWAAVVLVACGGGFSRDSAVESYVAANPDASTNEAECVVDRLIEVYGLDGLETELEQAPPSDAFAEQQLRARFACGLRDDIEIQLVDQLMAQGIEADDAACAGAALSNQLEAADLDVLLSGEITDDFYDKYFVSLEGCGALPE